MIYFIVQAELYEKSSLNTLAQQYYQQLWQQLQPHKDLLEKWEPQLLKHLQIKQAQGELLRSEWILLPTQSATFKEP